MFGRKAKKTPRHDAITAFLGAGTQYHGQFRFQGVVRIDGGVIGDIVSDGVLVLGEEGYVEGTIRVAELVTSGSIVGDVTASKRVTLHKRSNLRGDLASPIVVIEDGAVVNGRICMTPPEDAALVPGAPPAALCQAPEQDPAEQAGK